MSTDMEGTVWQTWNRRVDRGDPPVGGGPRPGTQGAIQSREARSLVYTTTSSTSSASSTGSASATSATGATSTTSTASTTSATSTRIDYYYYYYYYYYCYCDCCCY